MCLLAHQPSVRTQKKEKFKVETPHRSSADADTGSPWVIEPQRALHWHAHGEKKVGL